MRGAVDMGTLGDEEMDAWVDLLGQCFTFPAGAGTAEWLRREVGAGSYRVLREGDRIVAGLCVLEAGLVLLGREVPCAGVAVVAVPPERRGRGLASRLMVETLRELRDRGVWVSTLYPSALRVYERVGYARAGAWMLHEIATRALPSAPLTLEARRVGREDLEALRAFRGEVALRHHGALVRRHPFLWAKLFREDGDRRYGYLFEGPGGPEACLVYAQAPGSPVAVVDWGVTSAQGARDVLALLAGLRSTLDTVQLPGAPQEPLLDGLPEQESRVVEERDWMLRLIDVPRALEGRGYRPGVAEEVHLEVDDEVLEQNAGPWILKVEDGAATCTPGGDGKVRLDVRALAPLYTGHRTVEEVRLWHSLEGDEEDLLALGRALSAPRPSMIDRF